MSKIERPLLSSLACVNPDCALHGQANQDNLTVRKVYGQDQIRYLRCQACGIEFSERKNTALWNTKIPEARAIDVSRQLAEGTSLKGTARLTGTHKDTVRRLNGKFGTHAEAFHEQQAQDLDVDVLEMDERHGYAEHKGQQCWDAVAIDAASKFVLQVEVGPRDEAMFDHLMRRSAGRLAHPQDLVLMTDGEACYRTLFPVIFGVPYLPPGHPPSDDRPTRAIAFPARWRTSKSSSIVKDASSKLWKCSRRMGVGRALIRPSTRWATTRPTPPRLNASTVRHGG